MLDPTQYKDWQIAEEAEKTLIPVMGRGGQTVYNSCRRKFFEKKYFKK